MMFMLTFSFFLMMYIKCCFLQLMFFVQNYTFANLNYLCFVLESYNLLIYYYRLFLYHLHLVIKIQEILIFFTDQANFNFFLMFQQLRLLLFWKFHLMSLLQLLLHNRFQTILITKMSMLLLQILFLYFHLLLSMYCLLISYLAHCFLKPQVLDCSEYFYFTTS